MLREWQEKALLQIREGWKKWKSGVLAVQTGAGKSLLSMEIFRRVLEKDTSKKCIFFTERRILAQQAMLEGIQHGLDCGLDMANITPGMRYRGLKYKPSAPVQFCSWQTIEACGHYPKGDVIIVDEGHRWGSNQRRLAFDKHYSDAFRLYLTATPAFADGSTLHPIAKFLIQPTTTRELIEQGILVPSRVFFPDMNCLRNLDFVEDAVKIRKLMEQRMCKKGLIGDVVEKWKKHGEDRPTVYYGHSVDDSKQIMDEFRRAGITAEHIDAETDDDDRVRWFEQHANGDLKVICNFDVMTYGVNLPHIGCVIIRRPTRSLPLIVQIMGRGVRCGTMTIGQQKIKKENCIFLDHAGVTLYHQYAPGIREIEWRIDPNDNVDVRDSDDIESGKADRLAICKQCGNPFNASKTRQCPACGAVIIKPIREIIVEDALAGNLRELAARGAILEPHQIDALRKAWTSIIFQCWHQNQPFKTALARFFAQYRRWPSEFGLPFDPPKDILNAKDKKVRDIWPNLGRKK